MNQQPNHESSLPEANLANLEAQNPSNPAVEADNLPLLPESAPSFETVDSVLPPPPPSEADEINFEATPPEIPAENFDFAAGPLVMPGAPDEPENWATDAEEVENNSEFLAPENEAIEATSLETPLETPIAPREKSKFSGARYHGADWHSAGGAFGVARRCGYFQYGGWLFGAV